MIVHTVLVWVIDTHAVVVSLCDNCNALWHGCMHMGQMFPIMGVLHHAIHGDRKLPYQIAKIMKPRHRIVVHLAAAVIIGRWSGVE